MTTRVSPSGRVSPSPQLTDLQPADTVATAAVLVLMAPSWLLTLLLPVLAVGTGVMLAYALLMYGTLSLHAWAASRRR